jgi:tetraacyldisaccharide 4'-kinase
MIREPAFWQAGGPLAVLFEPVGAVTGAIAARRMARDGRRATVPVACIGNFTAGGAGKTPTAIAIADLLRAAGRRPVFLSRGYGGSVTTPTLVDGSRHSARQVGDEPLLLARHAPVVVAADRVAGATLAAALGDCIVMDDGLQNPSLAKDLRIAVVDGATGVGNGRCIPAGPLRAPLDAQLGHVDALVVIGAGERGEAVAARARSRGLPVFHAAIVPDPSTVGRLAMGPPVLAFAGIGRPEKFFRSLREAGVRVAATRAFADHAPYTRHDVAALMGEARRLGIQPVTTEKDRVRLDGVLAPGEAEAIAVLPVRLVFADAAGMAGLLAAKVRPS